MAGIKICPNPFCHMAFHDGLNRCPACGTYAPTESAPVISTTTTTKKIDEFEQWRGEER